eukprot:Sspe_Gene.60304::Locus_33215_Transcript_1_1_Confidence_1.000_Length_1438::g.60304::m.60304
MRHAGRVAQVLHAELTWTGRRFEPDVRVGVLDNGLIGFVERGGDQDVHFKDHLRHMPGEALLPGFVNCHSHAFQRGLRGKGETYRRDTVSSFWSWRQEMYKLVETLDKDEFFNLTKQCFEEMRAAGITTVGEFHYLHHPPGDERSFGLDEECLRAAAAAGVRIVLLNAYYQYAGFGRQPLAPAQQRFHTASLKEYMDNMTRLKGLLAPHQSLGVVAHSLRAVDVEQLAALHSFSLEQGHVFHLHIEEQPAEVQACKEAHGVTPMELFRSRVTDVSNVTAVHCNHTVPEHLSQFTSDGGVVCICPLTEGNLGDGIMADLASCNGRICIGTDCNARIDFLEEARLLEYSHRLLHLRRGVAVASNPNAPEDVAPELFSYMTEMGAASLGVNSGSIQAGKHADFAAIDLGAEPLVGWTADTLMASLIFGCGAREVVSRTCVGGKWSAENP